MTAKDIVSIARVGFSILFFWMVLAGPWTNLKTESFGVFESQGGAGFGIVATILGALMLVISLVVAAEKEFKIGPFAIGGNQLLLALSAASFTTLLSFLIVIHSGSFRDLGSIKGAGWGAAGACLVAYFFPQAIITGLGFFGVATSTSLNENDSKKIACGVFVSGALITISPFLEWFKTEENSWTGYQPGSPRMGFLMLVLGATMTLVGLMRLRPKGLVEPGGRLAHPHLQTVVALAAISPVVGWVITGFQREDMSIGIGVWVALIAGLLLLGVSLFEFTRREVTAS